MSRRQFAAHVDVAEGTIRRVEAGEPVHPASAKKIADFLGVKVTDLIGTGNDQEVPT